MRRAVTHHLALLSFTPSTLRCLILSGLAALSLWAYPAAAAESGPAAQVEKPASDQGVPDGAVFARLDEFLRTSPFEFKTSFWTRSDTLGSTRGEARFQVRHPNFFRIEVATPRETVVAISDGRTMTLFSPHEKKYATVPAPQTAREGLGIVTGLMSTPSRILALIGVMGEIAAHRPDIAVARARAETVSGRLCDGYTIVDQTATVTNNWRVWLDRRVPALPCKVVTTSSDEIDDATQTNEFTWTEKPTFGADSFVFTPPAGAREVSVGELGLGPTE